MLCITLDEQGSEVSKQECTNIPQNGFELRDDGNYYKQIGDPRIISDNEFKFKKEEKSYKKEIVDEIAGKSDTYKTVSGTDISTSYTVYPRCKIKYKDLRHNMSYYMMIDTGHYEEFVYPSFDKDFGITQLTLYKDDIKKLRISRSENTIWLWLNSRFGMPNIIIKEPFET